MLLAPALEMLYGEDGDDIRMIGHEMRELPERHLPTPPPMAPSKLDAYWS